VRRRNTNKKRIYSKRLRYNSVGIDLKELGGQLPKCLKFCRGLKFKADFHSKNERL